MSVRAIDVGFELNQIRAGVGDVAVPVPEVAVLFEGCVPRSQLFVLLGILPRFSAVIDDDPVHRADVRCYGPMR